MAHSVKVAHRTNGRRSTVQHLAITLTGSYATPGEAITAAECGLRYFTHWMSQGAMGQQTTGYGAVLEPDSTLGTFFTDSEGNLASTTLRLRFFQDRAAAGAQALGELANGAYGTPLTTLPVYAIVTGR